MNDLRHILGFLSTISFIIPVIIIFLFGFSKYRVYLALAVYCIQAFLYNLMTQQIILVPELFKNYFCYITNLLEIPLVMIFLMLFATSPKQRKLMGLLSGLFLVFEAIVIGVTGGITEDTVSIALGPGLALLLYFSIRFFVQRIKTSTRYQKAGGKAVLISAVLFGYICFTFIYVISYVVRLEDTGDVFLLYYLITLIYTLTLTTGLVLEKKRMNKREELQITRKELSEIFRPEHKEEKPAVPPPGKTADSWRFN